MRMTHEDGSEVETDSAREQVNLRARGYVADGPAKNKARTSRSSSSKRRTKASEQANTDAGDSAGVVTS